MSLRPKAYNINLDDSIDQLVQKRTINLISDPYFTLIVANSKFLKYQTLTAFVRTALWRAVGPIESRVQ